MRDNSSVIKDVVNYIEDNLENKLSLDDIAAKMGYSKFHLNRLFSKQVGFTIHKYIQMRRLTLAAEKLVNTDKPIVEIAYEANYDSQQSFSFAFRQEYGGSPQIYRVLKVYVPKQNKFNLESNYTMFHKYDNKNMRMVA